MHCRSSLAVFFLFAVVVLISCHVMQIRGREVTHIPEFGTPTAKQYAGYLPINATTGSNIFYYFVESLSDPMKSPVTLWLNGGPGVSSLMGLFLENGPFMMDATGKLNANKYSWNNISNMLYIDQPVGAGYSYTTGGAYPTTETQVAQQLYQALQLFFQKYSQYSTLDFYITGESYAGKYIPSLATYIHYRNLDNDTKINLKGIAIGNGWVDPIRQNQAYVDYPYNLGLIDSFQRDAAQIIVDKLVAAIDTSDWITANNLSNELEAYVLGAGGNFDIDNVLYYVDPMFNIFPVLDNYLNSPATRKAFNVGNHTWSFVNNNTENALNADEQKSVLHLLPNLIQNYRVVIYTGNMDMNCNFVGVEKYIDAMQWSNKQNFYQAKRGLWMVDNGADLAGYARSWPEGNIHGPSLTTLVVRNAGHEVPYFQPKYAFDLFYRFTQGKPFF